MADPPPPSPVNPIQTFMSPVSSKPKGDIPDRYHEWFSDVFLEMVIFPIFSRFDPLETPYEEFRYSVSQNGGVDQR